MVQKRIQVEEHSVAFAEICLNADGAGTCERIDNPVACLCESVNCVSHHLRDEFRWISKNGVRQVAGIANFGDEFPKRDARHFFGNRRVFGILRRSRRGENHQLFLEFTVCHFLLFARRCLAFSVLMILTEQAALTLSMLAFLGCA